MKILKIIVCTIFYCNTAAAVDLNSAFEIPCFNISNTVPVDAKFAGSLSTIYYPWMSRLDLYYAAAELLQKDPKDILESEIYYDSCFKWIPNKNGTISANGFGGYSREYAVKPIKPTPLENFDFRPVDGNRFGYGGQKYTTLTDNSTFLVTPFCTDSGYMTWGLGAATPTLPDETIEKVLQHVEAMGFKREFFTNIRYDNCGSQTETESPNQEMSENEKVQVNSQESKPIVVEHQIQHQHQSLEYIIEYPPYFPVYYPNIFYVPWKK